MKVVIVGASGYLGGRLAEFMTGFSKFDLVTASRKKEPPIESSPNSTHFVIDWSQKNLMDLCQNTSCIIYLSGINAAKSSDSAEVQEDQRRLKNILDAAGNQNVKRFIYLSSAHVYCSPLAGHIDEQSPLLNKHPYASNHIAKENLVKAYKKKYGNSIAIMRLSNAFGPPIDIDTDCWNLVVNNLCRQAVTSGLMILKNNGSQYRNFVSISNVCLAIMHLINLSNKDLGDGVFNFGSSQNMQLVTIVELLQEKLLTNFELDVSAVFKSSIVESAEEPLNYDSRKLMETGLSETCLYNDFDEIDSLMEFFGKKAIN